MKNLGMGQNSLDENEIRPSLYLNHDRLLNYMYGLTDRLWDSIQDVLVPAEVPVIAQNSSLTKDTKRTKTSHPLLPDRDMLFRQREQLTREQDNKRLELERKHQERIYQFIRSPEFDTLNETEIGDRLSQFANELNKQLREAHNEYCMELARLEALIKRSFIEDFGSRIIPLTERVRVKTERLPTRCEVCHWEDRFTPKTGICLRCEGIKTNGYTQ